jgi:hypothetical protein
MPTTTTSLSDSDRLEAVQQSLCRIAQPMFAANHWETGKLYDALASVVDYTRLISLPSANDHYQAEKASPLVGAALDVEMCAMRQYGNEEQYEQLEAIARAVKAAHEQLRPVLWTSATSSSIDQAIVDEALSAVHDLVAVLEQLPTRPASTEEGE